jgi:hypothetical protein
LHFVLSSTGSLNRETDEALCCTGYEHAVAGQLYDHLRSLVDRGLLLGKGDLRLPAGPRYTECGITPAGREALAPLLS